MARHLWRVGSVKLRLLCGRVLVAAIWIKPCKAFLCRVWPWMVASSWVNSRRLLIYLWPIVVAASSWHLACAAEIAPHVFTVVRSVYDFVAAKFECFTTLWGQSCPEVSKSCIVFFLTRRCWNCVHQCIRIFFEIFDHESPLFIWIDMTVLEKGQIWVASDLDMLRHSGHGHYLKILGRDSFITLIFQWDQLIILSVLCVLVSKVSHFCVFLYFHQVLANSFRIDQWFLEVFATVVHWKSFLHILLALNHIVKYLDCKVLVALEIYSWVLSLTAKIALIKAGSALVGQARSWHCAGIPHWRFASHHILRSALTSLETCWGVGIEFGNWIIIRSGTSHIVAHAQLLYTRFLRKRRLGTRV